MPLNQAVAAALGVSSDPPLATIEPSPPDRSARAQSPPSEPPNYWKRRCSVKAIPPRYHQWRSTLRRPLPQRIKCPNRYVDLSVAGIKRDPDPSDRSIWAPEDGYDLRVDGKGYAGRDQVKLFYADIPTSTRAGISHVNGRSLYWSLKHNCLGFDANTKVSADPFHRLPVNVKPCDAYLGTARALRLTDQHDFFPGDIHSVDGEPFEDRIGFGRAHRPRRHHKDYIDEKGEITFDLRVGYEIIQNGARIVIYGGDEVTELTDSITANFHHHFVNVHNLVPLKQEPEELRRMAVLASNLFDNVLMGIRSNIAVPHTIDPARHSTAIDAIDVDLAIHNPAAGFQIEKAPLDTLAVLLLNSTISEGLFTSLRNDYDRDRKNFGEALRQIRQASRNCRSPEIEVALAAIDNALSDSLNSTGQILFAADQSPKALWKHTPNHMLANHHREVLKVYSSWASHIVYDKARLFFVSDSGDNDISKEYCIGNPVGERKPPYIRELMRLNALTIDEQKYLGRLASNSLNIVAAASAIKPLLAPPAAPATPKTPKTPATPTTATKASEPITDSSKRPFKTNPNAFDPNLAAKCAGFRNAVWRLILPEPLGNRRTTWCRAVVAEIDIERHDGLPQLTWAIETYFNTKPGEKYSERAQRYGSVYDEETPFSDSRPSKRPRKRHISAIRNVDGANDAPENSGALLRSGKYLLAPPLLSKKRQLPDSILSEEEDDGNSHNVYE